MIRFRLPTTKSLKTEISNNSKIPNNQNINLSLEDTKNSKMGLIRNSCRPYYFLGSNRALTQLSNGLPFFVNTDDVGISPWIIMGGTWENFVDNVLVRLCEKGMRVCDLGANQGYYTIKLANIVGEHGYVLALEPNPELFSVLKNNVDINGFRGRVQLENVAASSEVGEKTLMFSESNMGGGTLFGELPPDLVPRSLQVETRPVDDILGDQPGFDIIKIDVEGWEPEVFRGMTKTLDRSAGGSIVTEVSWGHWGRFGDPAHILSDLIGAREGVFLIHQNGSLERVDRNDLSRFHAVGVSYALLTHWNEERATQIGTLIVA